jgi:hypothetical protein
MHYLLLENNLVAQFSMKHDMRPVQLQIHVFLNPAVQRAEWASFRSGKNTKCTLNRRTDRPQKQRKLYCTVL